MDGPSQSGADDEKFNVEDPADDDNEPDPNIHGAF
jgi:hypothetical protein